MEFTKEQIAKAEQCKTADELLALAKEAGFDITEEQAEVFFAATRKGELSDGDLDNVAGGARKYNGSWYSSDSPHYLITTLGNSCSLFKKSGTGLGHNCGNCTHRARFSSDPFTNYCTERKLGSDPLNPIK